MKKLMSVLTVPIVIAAVTAFSGCGSNSTSPLVTYVARDQNQGAPHLLTLNESSRVSTAVAIAIPTTAQYVASNATATAVVYERYDGSLHRIFLMGMDGIEKQLTTGPDDYAPEFSPDGKLVVYMSGAPSGDYQTFTVNIDGSNQEALYAPAEGMLHQNYPVFSPDGKSVVFFASKFGDRTGYYRMALTDTTPTLVYATSDWWGPAAFSGDGTKLLLTFDDGTEWNIASVNLDGTGFTPLTTNTDTLSFAPKPYKNLILFNRYDTTDGSFQIYVMDQSGENQTMLSATAVTYESLVDTFWDTF